MTAPGAPSPAQKPAEALQGLALEDGWTVIAQIAKTPGATGSVHSVSYEVERTAATTSKPAPTRAFLKALDLSSALAAPEPAKQLAFLTSAYEFEKELVLECRTMNRVVTAIGHGTVRLEGEPIPVPYLIFEMAGGGDVRLYRQVSDAFDVAWDLRSLHHIAVGMSQLHSAGIFHQDLKPSNVLVFPSTRGTDESKIGDVGRASRQNVNGPWDSHPIAGDPAYAPIEHLYGEIANDWNVRRRAGDLYQLGSLTLFYFTGLTMNAAITASLRSEHHWRHWHDTYRAALPHVRDAFDGVVADLDASLPPELTEIATLTRYLSEPDPLLRGHPRNLQSGASRYDMQRFVSAFNKLAVRAERKMRA